MSQITAQRILAVSLLSTERVKLRCVYDGSMLVVAGMERVEGNVFTWRKRLAQEVADAVENGWQVLVEEMTDTVSQHATPVLFSDPHPQELRPMLAVALDWYFAMYNAGTIQLQPGTEVCRITESSVDVSTDEKGRNRYNLDWQRIKGPQRAMMLACLAAEGYQPISPDWIEQLYAGLEVETMPSTPVERFSRALSADDFARERALRLAQEGGA
ncbi:hypothetical protein [Vreelandella alkaliphila]|uniref:Uncharacterized protein n=1 Tax=Vreelandella alkaliphila TaxID=272774 RepID=A0AAJ2S4K5_9GAMM|nr:hypothetical protein [Halomonas alkaliphila]MDX5979628.1 hypothetical protein [Halomonas alkaliphila]